MWPVKVLRSAYQKPRLMAHDPRYPPKKLVPVSDTKNLGGELGSCVIGLNFGDRSDL